MKKYKQRHLMINTANDSQTDSRMNKSSVPDININKFNSNSANLMYSPNSSKYALKYRQKPYAASTVISSESMQFSSPKMNSSRMPSSNRPLSRNKKISSISIIPG